ncbi:MAG: B12-binding domain-containing radical SAM protein [Promethearchaeota archaeon]
MNILYVNPAKLQSGLDAIIKAPPLNLVSIAAMVPEHEATLFDFKIHKFDETKFKRLLNRNDVVAITSMTPQISHALEVAKLAKGQGCITILGGYHPTLDPDYVIKDENVDYVIRGEGEHTFKELIDYLDKKPAGSSIREIDGLSYKTSDGNVKHNRDRMLEPKGSP